MASNYYQNKVADMNNLLYDAVEKAIKRALAEVGMSDKADEVIVKIMGSKLKIKKQKDPLMPKRPKSSFLYFCDEHRPKVRKENPEFKMADVMKTLGKLWSECKNKEKYVKLSTNAKQEYEIAMEHYNENNFYE